EGRARDQEKMRKLERRVDTLEVVYGMRYHGGTPSESIDVLAVYGDAKHSEPHGPPDGPYTKEIGPTQKMLEELVEMEELVKMEELEKEPHPFNGFEGVVGLSRWFKKMESVFEISKCAKDDKVKYVMCTLEGHALTWWNGNIHTLGISATLSMKGDDIDGYTNRFHELAMICPTLVTHEYKKIESYVWGLPERIQGNVTSSRPANIHEAVTMCHTP
ncbi:hypothetical protein Tco_1233872, partial [Tanacetum coccineum]